MNWCHCEPCHHELFSHESGKCDWCGSTVYVLAQYVKIGVQAIADKIGNKLRNDKLN